MNEPAIVLLSGGLDSATTAVIAKQQGFSVLALSFSYGQRHSAELDAARTIAGRLGVEDHRVIDIDLRALGGSALTADIPVPKDRTEAEMETGIPVTYVPARNTIFLSYALAYAEIAPASHVFIGVNALDYSGYPDCRPEFIAAYEKLARVATKSAVEGVTPISILAPLISMTKAEIVRLGMDLGIDYSLTVSCYDANEHGEACGRCDSCYLRRKGFEDAGLEDPTRYVTGGTNP